MKLPKLSFFKVERLTLFVVILALKIGTAVPIFCG